MRAVICGAGIAGLAVAQRLDAGDWDVVVLEKAPAVRTQGYMIDFFGPGYDAAEAMGILPRIHELGYRVDEVSYLDAAGRRRAGVNYAQFAKAVGGRLADIMRPDLERALRESLSERVDLRFSTSITGIDQHDDGVRVTLSDGTGLDADLLVGADGIHSTVRSLVFGPERDYLRYLGFHTAAYTFHDAELRAELSGRFYLTDTVGAQMGFYGLRDGRVAVFAVHRSPDATRPDDVPAALRREYGGLGWIVPRALAACPRADEVYYDQVAQIELPRWSHGHVTLVGDAGYAVSLLAGQGASLAIAGAYVLADQLAKAHSIPAGLDGYERLWRPLVEERQRGARSMVRWFLPKSPAELRVRRVALKLVRMPGADRYIAGLLAGKPAAIIAELGARTSVPTTPVPRAGAPGAGRIVRRRRPGPVATRLLRLPGLLYDHHAGWLLGRRFLYLTHVGRKSGRGYHTVLEVVGTDEESGEVMVVAGFGRNSDWYRNIQAHPPVEVVTGRRRFAPTYRQLDEQEAVAMLADYERRNRLIKPVIHRALTWLVGWRYDGGQDARHRLVRELPIVAFRPRC